MVLFGPNFDPNSYPIWTYSPSPQRGLPANLSLSLMRETGGTAARWEAFSRIHTAGCAETMQMYSSNYYHQRQATHFLLHKQADGDYVRAFTRILLALAQEFGYHDMGVEHEAKNGEWAIIPTGSARNSRIFTSLISLLVKDSMIHNRLFAMPKITVANLLADNALLAGSFGYAGLNCPSNRRAFASDPEFIELSETSETTHIAKDGTLKRLKCSKLTERSIMNLDPRPSTEEIFNCGATGKIATALEVDSTMNGFWSYLNLFANYKGGK